MRDGGGNIACARIRRTRWTTNQRNGFRGREAMTLCALSRNMPARSGDSPCMLAQNDGGAAAPPCQGRVGLTCGPGRSLAKAGRPAPIRAKQHGTADDFTGSRTASAAFSKKDHKADTDGFESRMQSVRSPWGEGDRRLVLGNAPGSKLRLEPGRCSFRTGELIVSFYRLRQSLCPFIDSPIN